MNVGDSVKTPRFLTVKIQEVFSSVIDMEKAGYTEPTHYDGLYEIKGKHIGENRMIFAAAMLHLPGQR